MMGRDIMAAVVRADMWVCDPWRMFGFLVVVIVLVLLCYIGRVDGK